MDKLYNKLFPKVKNNNKKLLYATVFHSMSPPGVTRTSLHRSIHSVVTIVIRRHHKNTTTNNFILRECIVELIFQLTYVQ